MSKDEQLDLGSVQVHKKALAEIISSACKDVDGISLVQKSVCDWATLLVGKSCFPGIRIKVDENQEVVIELRVIVQYGINIPDAARQIQETVREAVDKALDINLKDVNVNVQGIERGQK